MHGRFENVLQASGPDSRALQSRSLKGEVGTSGIQDLCRELLHGRWKLTREAENTWAL